MPAPIILDLPEYRAIAQLTTTDATRDAALQKILAEVNDAIRRYLRQPLDSATYTEYIDAPPSEKITLRYWPVTTVTTVRVAPGCGGDPTAFTSDTDWTQYKDWVLDTGADGTSRSAVLLAMRGYWSISSIRPVNRQATRSANDLKAIQVVYTAGYEQIPQSVKTAAVLMTSRILLMAKTGLVTMSAGLNGGSYSLAFPPGMNAGMLLSDPTIQNYLQPFCDIYV